MPGTIILKPLLADFDNNLSIELVNRVSPFCVAIIGNTKVKGPTCPKGGKHPFWKGTFYLPRNDEKYCFIEIKNHHSAHEDIGVTEINIEEVVSARKLCKYYPVYFKKKAAGQIMIQAFFVDKEYPGKFVGNEKLVAEQKDKKDQTVLPDNILPAELVEDGLEEYLAVGKDEADTPSNVHQITSEDFDLNADVSIDAMGESLPNLRTKYLVEEKLIDAEGLDAMNATTI